MRLFLIVNNVQIANLYTFAVESKQSQSVSDKWDSIFLENWCIWSINPFKKTKKHLSFKLEKEKKLMTPKELMDN